MSVVFERGTWYDRYRICRYPGLYNHKMWVHARFWFRGMADLIGLILITFPVQIYTRDWRWLYLCCDFILCTCEKVMYVCMYMCMCGWDKPNTGDGQGRAKYASYNNNQRERECVCVCERACVGVRESVQGRVYKLESWVGKKYWILEWSIWERHEGMKREEQSTSETDWETETCLRRQLSVRNACVL